MPEAVVYGLQRLNDETSNWLAGEDSMKPWLLECNPQFSRYGTGRLLPPTLSTPSPCQLLTVP